MTATLNIAALARRTGIQPDTLRKWERRYGVICPERTGGGQRRYSELDVARVEWLKARLTEGYRIGEAAQLLGDAELSSAPGTNDELRHAIADAVRRSDAVTLEVLVGSAFAVEDIGTALDEVIAPVLRSIGEEWHAGTLTVGQEHLASGIVRAHLERLLADTRAPVLGAAVLACPPGERHELGLQMLALMLRADGWRVVYLGTDTPLADALRLATDAGAKLLCVSATMPESVEWIDTLPPGGDTVLVLGGQAVTPEIAARVGGCHVTGALEDTVRRIREIGRQGRSTARRGPARKPASSSSGSTA